MSDNGFRLASVAEIIESATRMIRALSPQEILTELKTRPLTETLPLVKEWLAGEGYGLAKCIAGLPGEEQSCGEDCLFLTPSLSCILAANKGPEYPAPSKCPAMLKRAKEKK